MTYYNQQPIPPQRKINWLAVAVVSIITAILFTILGIGVGYALAPDPKHTTTTVEVASQDCTQFVRDADEMNRLSGEGFSIVIEIFDALKANDVAALNDAAFELQNVSNRITEHRTIYNLSRQACLDG